MTATETMKKEMSYTLRPGVVYPQLYFILHLQRKPHYYLINITLPCVFLTFIALLVCSRRRLMPITVDSCIFISFFVDRLVKSIIRNLYRASHRAWTDALNNIKYGIIEKTEMNGIKRI